MAGRPFVGGGPLPPSDHRSFLQALTEPPNTSSPIQDPTAMKETNTKPTLGMHKGEIAIKFPQVLIDKYSQPFRFALVGKFSQGRPALEIIRNFFKAQDLSNTFTVGLLDAKHIIINLLEEKDFWRIYSRNIWFISGLPMRIFKWTPHFHVDRESSIVPIWFKLPKLPINLVNKEALFEIAKTFGQPLRMDSATQNFKRPNIARIQVEIDLLKPIPDRVWIDIGDSFGFWQPIELDETLPLYCSFCWHVGHEEKNCHIKNPALRTAQKNDKNIQEKPKKVYVPKQNLNGAEEKKNINLGQTNEIGVANLHQAESNPQMGIEKENENISSKSPVHLLPESSSGVPTDENNILADLSLEEAEKVSSSDETEFVADSNNDCPLFPSKEDPGSHKWLAGKSPIFLRRTLSASNTLGRNMVAAPEVLQELKNFNIELNGDNHTNNNTDVQVVKKRRPRRNYFDLHKSVMTRSQAASQTTGTHDV